MKEIRILCNDTSGECLCFHHLEFYCKILYLTNIDKNTLPSVLQQLIHELEIEINNKIYFRTNKNELTYTLSHSLQYKKNIIIFKNIQISYILNKKNYMFTLLGEEWFSIAQEKFIVLKTNDILT
jgi:hypothetical protein